MNYLTGFLVLVAGTTFGYILGAVVSSQKSNREDLEEQYRQFVDKDSLQGKSDINKD